MVKSPLIYLTSDSSLIFDESQLDEVSTDSLLQQIEVNTRMTAQGISHIFSMIIVLIAVLAVWTIIHKWFFGGV